MTHNKHPQEGLPNVQDCVSSLVKGVDVDGNSTIDYNVRMVPRPPPHPTFKASTDNSPPFETLPPPPTNTSTAGVPGGHDGAVGVRAGGEHPAGLRLL